MYHLIELQDVYVSYAADAETVHALRGVNLKLQPGSFTLLSGASGSGKSTLLNVLAGLQPVGTGKAFVDAIDLTGADDDELARLRLRSVGIVFQQNNLIREFTAQENVELPLRARGYSASEAATEAASHLELVGIGELSGRRPAQLSGGQQQRVGIARALVGGRAILLADEPTGALDSINSRAIFAILRSLADAGACVVVASHDPAAEAFADRTLRMSDGVFVDEVARA